VTAFSGSGLPIYRQAVLHGLPFIYILKWMHTLSFITDPKWHVLYVWLFIAPFVILSCQTVYLPGTVHWENVSIPLCLLDCRSVFSKHYLDWADEADLVDEQTSEEDDWSDEDVLGTTFYPCCCLLLSKVTAKPAPFLCIVSTVLCLSSASRLTAASQI
jgi:hypothetical protein